MPRTRLYRAGALVAEDFPVEEIADRLADPGAVVWLDLCQATDADFEIIGEGVGLHELAVRDALSESQRPKLDRYASHLFLCAHIARLDPGSGSLSSHEINVFVTPQALITVRKDETIDIEAVAARWDDASELARFGVAFLLYGLLDYIVDSHFSAVQDLDGGIEELEDLLFDERRVRARAVQQRSYQLRKSLVVLRRVVLPMREVVSTLMRPTTHAVDERMVPYYVDVYDHVLRVAEWTESLRDLVTTILETNQTVQGNQLNMIMKKLTGWAAIIAVPTAVTGFYGQNVPYPGFGHWSGFVASSVLTVVLSVGLYVTFRRRDWL